MRRCGKCGAECGGRACKPCRAEYMRQYRIRPAAREAEKKRKAKYYEAHRDELREKYLRQYYEKHEKRKAQKREYRKQHARQERARWEQWKRDHPERVRAYFAKYYEDRREAKRAADNRRRAVKKEDYNAARRKKREQTPRGELQERSRKAYRKNPEAYKTRARNREARVKGAEGSHTRADVRRQYVLQDGKCFWCGTRLGTRFHVDHLIPISKGGSNGPENIVAACGPCNLKKGSQRPLDWALRRGTIT